MDIRLNNDQTFTCRPYRMAPKKNEIVVGMIQELLENEIILPSQSPYASPVLLERKKNGESRLCITRLQKIELEDCKRPLSLTQD